MVLLPIIEYTFLQHFYIASKDIYERILYECINTSPNLKRLGGGKFELIQQQAHGEYDVFIPVTNYGIDFKLMISGTLAEFRNLSRTRAVEIASGVTVEYAEKIQQYVVLFPNALRNMDEKQLISHRSQKNKLSKDIVHFFDHVLNKPKNILLFLPLYVATVDEDLTVAEAFEKIRYEFSHTLQYIYWYRDNKQPNFDTYFVYIVNHRKKQDPIFVISKFTPNGLCEIDKINMFSLPKVKELSQDNIPF